MHVKTKITLSNRFEITQNRNRGKKTGWCERRVDQTQEMEKKKKKRQNNLRNVIRVTEKRKENYQENKTKNFKR